MAAFFLDSSALVKRYVSETGSSWVVALTDPVAANDIILARLTAVEVISALVRKERAGYLSSAVFAKAVADFRQDVDNQYEFVPIRVRLIERAMALASHHALRAYDAVQLAAALQVSAYRVRRGASPLKFVCADANLNVAAAAEGLPTDDPNAHP